MEDPDAFNWKFLWVGILVNLTEMKPRFPRKKHRKVKEISTLNSRNSRKSRVRSYGILQGTNGWCWIWMWISSQDLRGGKRRRWCFCSTQKSNKNPKRFWGKDCKEQENWNLKWLAQPSNDSNGCAPLETPLDEIAGVLWLQTALRQFVRLNIMLNLKKRRQRIQNNCQATVSLV